MTVSRNCDNEAAVNLYERYKQTQHTRTKFPINQKLLYPHAIVEFSSNSNVSSGSQQEKNPWKAVAMVTSVLLLGFVTACVFNFMHNCSPFTYSSGGQR